MNRKFRSERGVVLVLTMVLLFILIAVLSQLAFETKTEVRTSRAYKGDLENQAALDAARQLGRKYLMIDAGVDEKRKKAFDAKIETWATEFDTQELGNTRFSFRIQDEARRLNLNLLAVIKNNVRNNPKKLRNNSEVFNMFLRLFSLLKLDESLLFRIKDFIDRDDEGQYEGENTIDRSPVSPQELLQITELEPKHLFGSRNRPPLLGFVTIWPGPEDDSWDNNNKQHINVNTAPLPVLMSLSDEMSKTAADKLIRYRNSRDQQGNKQVYRSANEFIAEATKINNQLGTELAKVKGYIGVTANYYSLMTKLVSEGTTETARTVVKKEGPNTAPSVVWFNRSVDMRLFGLFQEEGKKDEQDQ